MLVFKVDRLTRSTKNLIELVELFEEYNCAFNSLTESIDTDTPSGRMFLKIIGIFAEFERENLVSRLKLGFERKVKEGYTLATNTFSYGYIRRKGNRIQEVQQEEARIVREIFSMYLDENKSINKIAKALNERKIKAKMGGEWTVTTVRGILSNSTYIGKVRYATKDEDKYFEVDGQHERILSDEIFWLAQDRIKKRALTSRTKQPKEENYFCGVLVCGSCGSKFTTHHRPAGVDKQGEKLYNRSYKCGKKTFHRNVTVCKPSGIAHFKVEKAFVQYIKGINDFADIKGISLDTENNKADKEHEHLEYISTCENKLNNFANRKKRLMAQYVGEEIPFEEYREMIDILNEKFEALENELQRAKKDMQVEDNSPNISYEDIILNLKENWNYLDNKERMIFLQRFVKKIVIKVVKERVNSNVATIEEVVFN